jgi:glucose-6-phosphate isomerase
VDAGLDQPVFREARLTFGLVLLPPLKIGCEFVKSHGHYHSTLPGSQIGYAEVYSHYYGELFLYLQRRELGSASRIDDCVLYKMKPGCSILIPPGYAHILINASDGPAIMGGLYSPDAEHDYRPIREMAGGAYYMIEVDGMERILPNPKYAACPPLRCLQSLTVQADARFAPPDNQLPLWSSFVQDPQLYAFITQTEKAQLYFRPEDQLP